jgi:DNA repair protein RadC
MDTRTTTMRDLGPRDGPREKLDRSGVGALGDNELLAVVIGHGTAGVSALAAANRLLIVAGGLHGLMRLGGDQIAAVPGLGPVKASRVRAALELGRRTLTRSARARPRLATPEEAAHYLAPLYGAYPVERLGMALLDTRYRLIREQILSVGGLDGTPANPRDVFRPAIAAGAFAVLLFHNHPSGDPTPSKDDVKLTQRLAAAGDLVGVPVVDHVILADTQYCSLRRSGAFEWRE